MYIGVGIGGTTFKVNSDIWDDIDKAMCFNSRAGIDFLVDDFLFISTEVSFYQMISFDIGGGGRSNKMFQFKIGLGLMFEHP